MANSTDYMHVLTCQTRNQIQSLATIFKSNVI